MVKSYLLTQKVSDTQGKRGAAEEERSTNYGLLQVCIKDIKDVFLNTLPLSTDSSVPNLI